MFDVKDAVGILADVKKAIEERPGEYVKMSAYDARLGRRTTAPSFIVHRSQNEKGFRVERTTDRDRVIKYSIHFLRDG